MGIFRLFSKSPFEPLKELLLKVDVCIAEIKPMFEANFRNDFTTVKNQFRKITAAEHQADEIKKSIRDNLPRSILLPIDRWHFLEIISSADKIADTAEDLAYMMTVRDTRIPEKLQPDLLELLDKTLECYTKLKGTVMQLDDLLDSGFSGPFADEVLENIDTVGHLEWETDKLGYKFSQKVFEMENEMSPIDLIMIRDIAKVLSKFADCSEHLAKDIRRTLAH